MTIAEKITRAKADYDEVYEAGQQAEYDRFWDNQLNDGKRYNFDNAFAGQGWTNETCRPNKNISVASAYMMFRYCGVTGDMVEWLDELGITFDDSRNANTQYMYSYCNFTRIGTVTFSKVTSTGDTFAYARKLHTIDKIISHEGLTFSNSCFVSCRELANVAIEGIIASNFTITVAPLTPQSMKSVINHLKNYAGTSNEYAYTVKFNEACWTALEADSTAPTGDTWADYVFSLGWNT